MPAVAALFVRAASSGRRYLRYRNAHGGEWLFPIERRYRSAATELYRPFKLGGRARRALMRTGMGGRGVVLDAGTLSDLERAVADALGRQAVRLAFYTNGADGGRKTSMIAADLAGRPLAFGKSADGPEVERGLEREHSNLVRLNGASSMVRSCPQPFGWIVHQGRPILLTSLGPSRAGPATFGPLHASFLGALREAFGATDRFGQSALWRNAVAQMQRAELGEGGAWGNRFQNAASILEHRLVDVPMTLTLAHRDFAPWNTRVSPHGLFVFDWEFGSQGYPWSHDAFHFEFMTALLLGGSVSQESVRSWIDRVRAWEPDADASLLFLAYLFDLGLQYRSFEIDHWVERDEPVLDAVAKLLDSVKDWIG